MPCEIYNKRVRVKKACRWKAQEMFYGDDKIRPLREYTSYWDFDKEDDRIEDTIFKARAISIDSKGFSAIGKMNDDFNIHLTGKFTKNVEIEFPNALGKNDFHLPSDLYSVLGSMGYMREYKHLEILSFEYDKEMLEQFFSICNCFNGPIERCDVGELAQFIYYVMQYLCVDLCVSSNDNKILPMDLQELIKEIENASYEVIKSKLDIKEKYSDYINKGEKLSRSFLYRVKHLVWEMLRSCPIDISVFDMCRDKVFV